MRLHRLFHRAPAAMLILAGWLGGQPDISAAQISVASPIPRELPPMPESVTSFGAVTSGDWLYVFGGHKGKRHDYSAEMVSGAFHRLNLAEGREWEVLPQAAPGQGLPLVEHNGSVYRIGGMAAKNADDEKQRLFSTRHFDRFDPEKGEWQELPDLPEPRSSHDAVVIEDKLYVAGGWHLTGKRGDTTWHDTALVFDLANPEAGWTEFSQPFERRALATAAIGTRLYCIGGMDSNNESTLAVEIYDTATGKWTSGPELPAGRNKGFACSAIAQDGRIYASAFKGDLLRLAADGQSWEVLKQLEHRRMAHRLVRAGASQLIALGGEDGSEKRPELELLSPAARPVASAH